MSPQKHTSTTGNISCCAQVPHCEEVLQGSGACGQWVSRAAPETSIDKQQLAGATSSSILILFLHFARAATQKALGADTLVTLGILSDHDSARATGAHHLVNSFTHSIDQLSGTHSTTECSTSPKSNTGFENAIDQEKFEFSALKLTLRRLILQ